jgi:formiminoglutamase
MKLNSQPIPKELLFKGRPGDPRMGEWVQLTEQTPSPTPHKETVVILGTPDDMGVIRNLGRAGAKEGPNSIRKHLYKMALPMDLHWENHLSLYDAGNTQVSSNILETHQQAQRLSMQIASQGHTVITLGGGHDVAAPHFLGFVEGRKTINPREKTALINIDPHLDVREMEDGLPHSGTAFRQILESGAISEGGFVEFGARSNRNSRQHFEYVTKRNVLVMTWESLRMSPEPISGAFKHQLERLARCHHSLGVTLDLDSCSEAEGMSAAPVIGFSAAELYTLASLAGSQPKVRFFELAEVAPPLDSTERSSRIAAELIYSFLRSRALALSYLAPLTRPK